MIKKYFEIEFLGKELPPQVIEETLNATGANVKVCQIEILDVVEIQEDQKTNINLN